MTPKEKRRAEAWMERNFTFMVNGCGELTAFCLAAAYSVHRMCAGEILSGEFDAADDVICRLRNRNETN